jgi:hypothetical protein
MRHALALTVLLGAGLLARTQERPAPPPGEIAPRFDVRGKLRTYPQGTPKQALGSVIAAADAGDYAYILAHLMDPQFVDQRLADRAKQYSEGVEKELVDLRERQKKNPAAVPSENRVPDDPAKFRDVITANATRRALKQLVADLRDKLTDDPQVLKDLRRFLREGAFDDAAGTTARAALPDVKDRGVYFKKVGDRWFVENRQTPEEKKDAPPDEKKKDPDEKKP